MRSATHDVTTLLDDLLPAIQEALVQSVLRAWVEWVDHPEDPDWLLPRSWTSAVGTSPVPGQTLEVK